LPSAFSGYPQNIRSFWNGEIKQENKIAIRSMKIKTMDRKMIIDFAKNWI